MQAISLVIEQKSIVISHVVREIIIVSQVHDRPVISELLRKISAYCTDQKAIHWWLRLSLKEKEQGIAGIFKSTLITRYNFLTLDRIFGGIPKGMIPKKGDPVVHY